MTASYSQCSIMFCFFFKSYIFPSTGSESYGYYKIFYYLRQQGLTKCFLILGVYRQNHARFCDTPKVYVKKTFYSVTEVFLVPSVAELSVSDKCGSKSARGRDEAWQG